MQAGPSRWRHWLIPLAALMAVGLLWRAQNTGSFDPAARDYGTNWPGDLVGMLELVGIELAVLYAVLRPWSYYRSWRRTAVAFGLFLPLTLLAFVASMHAGAIVFAHVVWLALVTVGLFVTLLVSGAAAAGYPQQAA